MGREAVLFKSEEKMLRNEAAAMMRSIADKLEAGELTLSKGKKEVKLSIPNRVEVELKAEKEVGKKKTKKKIEIEIEWLVGDSAKKSGPVVIK